MKKLILIPILAISLAACGGTNYDHTFRNKAQFEAYVAGYLVVPSVSCVKTAQSTAECTTSDGDHVVILCQTEDAAGGHDCIITPKP